MSGQPSLNLNNYSLSLTSKRNAPLLEKTSFCFGANRTYILSGPNGIGKSLFAKSLIGLNQVLPIQATGSATMCINDLPLDILKQPATACHSIAYVPQDPSSALTPLKKVSKQLFPSNPPLAADKILVLAKDYFTKLGLTPFKSYFQRYPHMLSGGELQRVAIIQALLRSPQFLICDEITSALDNINRQRIFSLLKSYQDKSKCTILYISHECEDLPLSNQKYITFKDHKLILDRSNTFSAPTPKKKTVLPASIPRPLLSARNLSILPGNNRKKSPPLLKNISFDIFPGQITGLVGPSGSGKTTVAQAIMNQHLITGKLSWHDQEIKDLKLSPAQLGIRYLFQNPYSSFNRKRSIEHHIKDVFRARNLTYNHNLVRRTFNLMKVDPDVILRYPDAFSGGELQKIALTLHFLAEPLLSILDEPTSSLSVQSTKDFISSLCTIKKHRPHSTLLISHDSRLINTLCDDVITLNKLFVQ